VIGRFQLVVFRNFVLELTERLALRGNFLLNLAVLRRKIECADENEREQNLPVPGQLKRPLPLPDRFGQEINGIKRGVIVIQRLPGSAMAMAYSGSAPAVPGGASSYRGTERGGTGRRPPQLPPEKLIQRDAAAFACEKNLVDARQPHVILLEQKAAVNRVLDVGRIVSLAEDRREMEKFRAAHENEALNSTPT